MSVVFGLTSLLQNKLGGEPLTHHHHQVPCLLHCKERDLQEWMWRVKWFAAESCKSILNRYVKSLSFLPVICLLSAKARQNNSQSSLHHWWLGSYPKVCLQLAQDFLKSAYFFLVILQPVILFLTEFVIQLSTGCVWPHPNITTFFCELRWNCCLMTGHFLVRKQSSKPPARLQWHSTHHKHGKAARDTQGASPTIQRTYTIYCMKNDSGLISLEL